MSEEPIFEQLGSLLLERLRREMVPAVLHQEDDIKLTHPGAETDYRFGVFLHDMEEVRPYGPPSSVRVNEDTRRHPDQGAECRRRRAEGTLQHSPGTKAKAHLPSPPFRLALSWNSFTGGVRRMRILGICTGSKVR